MPAEYINLSKIKELNQKSINKLSQFELMFFLVLPIHDNGTKRSYWQNKHYFDFIGYFNQLQILFCGIDDLRMVKIIYYR